MKIGMKTFLRINDPRSKILNARGEKAQMPLN